MLKTTKELYKCTASIVVDNTYTVVARCVLWYLFVQSYTCVKVQLLFIGHYSKFFFLCCRGQFLNFHKYFIIVHFWCWKKQPKNSTFGYRVETVRTRYKKRRAHNTTTYTTSCFIFVLLVSLVEYCWFVIFQLFFLKFGQIEDS